MNPYCVPNIDEPLTRISFDTALGLVTITASAKGLIAINLPRRSVPKSPEPLPAGFTRLVESFRAYFDGRKVDFPVKLDLRAATPFQVKVWQAARLIPYGETRSYRWIAEQIGQPEAVRAVGQALGKNPLPIIIPCHRVLASDGALGGYSGGLEIKRTLLNLEKGIFIQSASR